MKTLHEYIKDMDQRMRLALTIGCTPQYLLMIANGTRQASPKMAQGIEKHTRGKVQKSELRPDLWSRRP